MTWGQRKRFADGKVSLPYKRFLGYEKGADGRPKIVEREAKVVRQIYQMYLAGQTIRQICAALTEQGVPTPGGKEKWSVSTVNSILRNEKYKGEALLQKTFCEDFLTKKMVKNEGQVPQFYVTESHPSIISPELFELVQQEIAKNAGLAQRRSNSSPFSGKIVCTGCGEVFNARTWHSKDTYKRRVWQCGGKYRERGNVKCRTPHLTEDQVKAVFCEAFNQIISDRERYLEALEPAIRLLTDSGDLDKDVEIFGERSAGLYAQMGALVADNARRFQAQSEYQRQFDDLNARYETVKSRLAEAAAERQSRMARREKIQRFIEAVRSRDALLERFDEDLWRATVECVKVQTRSDIRVQFRDGREIRVDISR